MRVVPRRLFIAGNERRLTGRARHGSRFVAPKTGVLGLVLPLPASPWVIRATARNRSMPI